MFTKEYPYQTAVDPYSSHFSALTNRMFQGGLQADDFQELFRSLGLEGPEFLGISESEDIFGRFFFHEIFG